MPVQIGAKTHAFSDPMGLLSDCHRRIEMFLGSLQRVAKAIDRPLTQDDRTALESALRYFKDAAPKHTADEEESLFPRLRQVKETEIGNALSTLNALEKDHARAEALHAEVHALGVRCVDEGHLAPVDAGRFRQAVSELTSIYREHIRIEDELMFPAAKQALSESQKAEIANEMAARREPGK
jgi:hemerythrin-like domain-containing protein